MQDISAIRTDYKKRELSESEVEKNAFDQFNKWFNEALRANIPEANAMTLSTVNEYGQPSGRIVLLKGFDENGFVFFTNYSSSKGHDLEVNPKAGLTFFWQELERQVRVVGEVQKVTIADSDEYFNSRPLESRIGALASPQSQAIPNREWLAENYLNMEKETGDSPKRPDHWGGYLVVPSRIEFWQGRPSRLHDRILYTRELDSWKIERLAP